MWKYSSVGRAWRNMHRFCRSVWDAIFLVCKGYILGDGLCVSITVGGNLTLESASIFLDKRKDQLPRNFCHGVNSYTMTCNAK